MNTINASDLLQLATHDAKAYRDQVLAARGNHEYVTSVVVTETVMGPNGYRVACGQASFPRCHADQFTTGVLTIASMDDGYELRVYLPGFWKDCTCYGPDGHIAYSWEATPSDG